MDRGTRSLAAFVTSSLLIWGCGTSSAPTDAVVSDNKPPEAITAEFLDAVRVGDDAKAGSLLTNTARKRTAEKQMVVAPPGSETATFAVREVMHVDGGAHVASDWSDVDPSGNMHTDRIVWLLRQEPEGWRIAGMATKVFADQPPVVLNFEDPEDMARQKQWAEEEIARRDGQQTPAGSEESGAAVRQ